MSVSPSRYARKPANWTRLSHVFLIIIPLLPALAVALVLPSQTMVQDRYAYTAVLGFSLLLACLIRYRPLAWVVAAAVVACSLLSVKTIGQYRDTETFWTNTLRVTPDSRNAILGLGDWYYATAEFAKADEVYQRGLGFYPGDWAILTSQKAVRKALAAQKQP